MNTSSRFNVKGNTFEMVSSPTSDAEAQMALVEWINSLVPHIYIFVKASDEELRASLLDGYIFSQILQRLKYSSGDEGVDSSSATGSRRREVQRFIAAVSEMGLPSFEIIDLEKGSMKPVLDCLLALKEYTNRHFGSPVYNTVDRKKVLSEINFQCSYSPLPPESSTMLLHGGYKFHEVFQKKQGLYADLPATKISEMIKSDSLDNTPTQSLLSVIIGILDESIDIKDAELPQHVVCLLRKVVQEIERRVATQGEHLRTQSNHFKAREKKYQSRIKVLEALAKGTSEENEIFKNQLQHMKCEISKMEEKLRFQQQEEEKSSEQKQMEKKRFEQQVMEEKTRFEQLMEEKKRFEEEAANKLKKLTEETDIKVSTLKQELETAKQTHELLSKELKTEAEQLKSQFEKKLRQQEQLLEDSNVKVKELELNSQSESQDWIKKAHIYEKFINLQLSGIEDLRHSSVSIKQEVLKTKKTYLLELDHVGSKLKSLAKETQNYDDVLNENRKLYEELDAARNKEGKDVKELTDQVSSLKDTLAKKDEEIERLLKDPKSPSIASMHSFMTGSSSPNNNPLKSGPSSSSTRSITSSPRKRPTVTWARRPGNAHKSFDSFLDHSDPSSKLAFEDFESEGPRPSRTMSDLKFLKKHPVDYDMMMAIADGDDENDDRLSETFSIGTDQTDATFESNVSTEASVTSDSSEKRREKQLTRALSRASRLSRVKASLRTALGLKKSGRENSSRPIGLPDGGSKLSSRS